MQWRLILEKYFLELINIQGSKHIAVDALSVLLMVDTPNPVKNNIKSVNEHHGLEVEEIKHPTNYKTIAANTVPYRAFMGPIRNILLSVEISKL